MVGRLSEGRLGERLEGIALSLDDGEVSEPIPVRGGAILLHVSDVVEGATFTLDEVRDRVEQQVRNEQLADRLRERADAVVLPDDAMVLGEDELVGQEVTTPETSVGDRALQLPRDLVIERNRTVSIEIDPSFTPEDRLEKRQALQWGLLILAGLVIWLVGLTQA